MRHYCHQCGCRSELDLRSYLCLACYRAWIRSRPPSAAPKAVLDVFCGIGGAARGYADAGFEVWGGDLNPKLGPDYLASGAYRFFAVDALDMLADRTFVRHF